MIRKATLERWTPPRETIEAIGLELCSHWMATHANPRNPFWPRPVSWLKRQAHRLTGGTLSAHYS